jgi:SH3 domain-containing YSC84-like protein 1
MPIPITSLRTFSVLLMASFGALPAATADDASPSPRQVGMEYDVHDFWPANGDPAETDGPEEPVRRAARILRELEEDPALDPVLEQARGVLLVPDYAVAALIAGLAGGNGILLSRREGSWRQPAFYNFAHLSVGPQAGAAGGSVAYFLMSERALGRFAKEGRLALTAEAGLNLIEWSARAGGKLGQDEDIIVWTETEGLLAELSLGISELTWDEEKNRAYYGQAVTPADVLEGRVEPPDPNPLALE